MDTKSFNPKIGFITNLASNLIAMRYNFKVGTPERQEVEKRIDILRYYQGTCIDACKGDIFVPPPKYWYKKQKYKTTDGITDKTQLEEIKKYNEIIQFNNKVCCDRKAYFFGYIYAKYMNEYTKHKKNYNKMCKLLYNMNLYSLITKNNKTKEEKSFIQKYYKYTPLLKNKCTMNILSEYIESIEFDNKWKNKPEQFDYTMLMSKNYDISDKKMYNDVKLVMKQFISQYNIILSERNSFLSYNIESIIGDVNDIYDQEITFVINDFENRLLSISSNMEQLVNYLVDVYYNFFDNSPKMLLWGEFGEQILNNIKSKSTHALYPTESPDGIEYLGRKYVLKEVDL